MYGGHFLYFNTLAGNRNTCQIVEQKDLLNYNRSGCDNLWDPVSRLGKHFSSYEYLSRSWLLLQWRDRLTNPISVKSFTCWILNRLVKCTGSFCNGYEFKIFVKLSQSVSTTAPAYFSCSSDIYPLRSGEAYVHNWTSVFGLGNELSPICQQVKKTEYNHMQIASYIVTVCHQRHECV